jgi:hypothetical protein
MELCCLGSIYKKKTVIENLMPLFLCAMQSIYYICYSGHHVCCTEYSASSVQFYIFCVEYKLCKLYCTGLWSCCAEHCVCDANFFICKAKYCRHCTEHWVCFVHIAVKTAVLCRVLRIVLYAEYCTEFRKLYSIQSIVFNVQSTVLSV